MNQLYAIKNKSKKRWLEKTASKAWVTRVDASFFLDFFGHFLCQDKKCLGPRGYERKKIRDKILMSYYPA